MYLIPEYKEKMAAYLKYIKIFPDECELDIIDIIREKSAGEGTVNLVYRAVNKETGESLIIKQILPYVNSIKELEDAELEVDMKRLEYEVKVETYFNDLWDGICPEIYNLNYKYGFIVEEDLAPLQIMRYALGNGQTCQQVGKKIGAFLASVNFFTSKYYLGNSDKNESAAFFNSQNAKKGIRELIYGKYSALFDENAPLKEEALNRKKEIINNPEIVKKINNLGESFYSDLDCLCHNDLHLGNLMVDDDTIKIIDAEFGGYSAAFTDLSKLMGSFLVNYVATWGRDDMSQDEKIRIQDYDLRMIQDLFNSYYIAMKRLWKNHEAAYPIFRYRNVDIYYKHIFYDAIQNATINAMFRVTHDKTMSYDVRKITDEHKLGMVQEKLLHLLENFLSYGLVFEKIEDVCAAIEHIAGVKYN